MSVNYLELVVLSISLKSWLFVLESITLLNEQKTTSSTSPQEGRPKTCID